MSGPRTWPWIPTHQEKGTAAGFKTNSKATKSNSESFLDVSLCHVDADSSLRRGVLSKLSSLPRITSHFFVCVIYLRNYLFFEVLSFGDICCLTGADRSVRFPRRAAGADERSGSTSGDTGGKRSGTGEEPERLQKWFVLNKIIYWHKILNIVKPLCVNTITLTLPAFFLFQINRRNKC